MKILLLILGIVFLSSGYGQAQNFPYTDGGQSCYTNCYNDMFGGQHCQTNCY